MRVLVAMSGGVDSSVAALILKNQGYEVIGLHMLLHEESPETCDLKKKTCCSSLDALDAKKVADVLGIQFEAVPLHKSFNETVLNNFISEYKDGRTPIPCTHCNSNLKFDRLFKIADSLDCQFIATGHYITRIMNDLWMSENQYKDQTYFLWAINKERISRLLFPCSDYTKDQIRQMAKDANLPTASKSESMDICFVPNGNYRDVLSKLDPYFSPREGKIVLIPENKVIGIHSGHWNFTVGQRRGLPAHSKKIYVKSIDASSNTIYATTFNNLGVDSFLIRDINMYNDFLAGYVKVQSRSKLIPCTLRNGKVNLLESTVITPGQAAVFYSNQNGKLRLDGGGWIDKVIEN